MLGAGVVHSFLDDIVPALALGVPDAATAVAALPGHRLVVAGARPRGGPAVRGRIGASGRARGPACDSDHVGHDPRLPVVRNHLPLLFGRCGRFFLCLPSRRSGPRSAGSSPSSRAPRSALQPSMSTRAAPLDDAAGSPRPFRRAVRRSGAYRRDGRRGGRAATGRRPDRDEPSRARNQRGRRVARGRGRRVRAGGISAIAAVAALPAVPREESDRGFVVATSGANTANTIFALFALVALGTPLTGGDRRDRPRRGPLRAPDLARRRGRPTAAACGFALVLLVGATRTSESSGTRTTRGCRSACWRCSWGYPTRSLAQSGSACSSSPGRWGSSRRGSARDGCT